MRLSPRSPSRLDERRPAVFIDKDGTLVEDVPYNVDPDLLRFTPHAVTALRQLADAGFLLIVVSNQPGLALGRFDLAALQRLAEALTARLAAEGVALAGFYACPHLPSHGRSPGSCLCRKPAPGLLHEAAAHHGVDLPASWMVGDILDDVEAGRRAGCRAIHLDVGHETVWKPGRLREPTHTAPHLLAAAEFILAGGATEQVQSAGAAPPMA